MDIDWTEIIKYTLSIIAILISVISATIAWKNTQKQIRENKLEEIVSILYNFHRMYNRMFWLLIDLQKELDPKNHDSLGYDWDEEKKVFFESTKEYIPKDNFNRLRILANAYLPNNNVKFRLMAIGGLYSELFMALETRSDYNIIEKYEGKIPKPGAVSNFILLIEKDLIKEMNLGFDGMTISLYKKYKEKHFLVDIGVKEKS
ncbi:hypothetical protein [Flavobacterium sp. AED]|jgi:hypothetical protein|uniref:hypothetical protein n=1 Tax=Flavobacterium sp. AED TaxID=1423323 RepID=UPI00057F9C6F|nr:hypothetical protein [Flavobacterium sp. AED]KIA82422.1 hypothetical protein OA85_16270 [Flavobacterium sp. AED]